MEKQKEIETDDAIWTPIGIYSKKEIRRASIATVQCGKQQIKSKADNTDELIWKRLSS